MANNYGDEQVVCPYYVEQSNTAVKCQGKIQADELAGLKGQYGLLQFSSVGQKDKWLQNYCTGFAYHTCPYCKDMDAHWDKVLGGKKNGC